MRANISTFFVAILAALVMGTGCGKSGEDSPSHTTTNAVPDRPVEEVMREHTDHLMRIDGVVSVGQALCEGTPCIRVGVRVLTDSLRSAIPESLEGHPVDLHEIGTVRPLDDGS